MKVLIVKPNEEPFAEEIDGSLQSMQAIVGGYIQAVYLFDGERSVLVCNEEGKLDGLAPNRPLHDSKGNITDIICGDFFIAGDGEEDFVSLTDEQVDKYTKMFGTQSQQLDVNINDKQDEIVRKEKTSREER